MYDLAALFLVWKDERMEKYRWDHLQIEQSRLNEVEMHHDGMHSWIFNESSKKNLFLTC